MTITEPIESFDQSLSKQLHRFSELSETLTLRLLELEERIKSIETVQIGTSEHTKQLLQASEERVRHLEHLLNSSQVTSNTFQALDEDSSGGERLKNIQELEITKEISGTKDLEKEEPSYVQGLDENEFAAEDNIIDTEYVDDPQTSLLSA